MASWHERLIERAVKPTLKLSPEEFLSYARPKCKQIVVGDAFEQLIKSKKKLRIKLGIDPTGAEMHLGHAVPLMLLRLFQRAGHEVHFIIGDFTAQIGDPAGRSDQRKELTQKEIERNFRTYTKQIAPLLNIRKARVHRN